jgi:hypothetical protein
MTGRQRDRAVLEWACQRDFGIRADLYGETKIFVTRRPAEESSSSSLPQQENGLA